MREIQIDTFVMNVKPAKSAVRRLQFDATGARLVAWVGGEWMGRSGQGDEIEVFAYDFAKNQTRPLSEAVVGELSTPLLGTPPAVTPDLRFLVMECHGFDGGDGFATIFDLTKPAEPHEPLPTDEAASGGLLFTPDGEFLIAGHYLAVQRFPMKTLTGPTRYRQALNPFTGRPMQVPDRDMRWQSVAAIPGRAVSGGDAISALGVSANGRRVAVGTRGGAAHVIDLQKKKVVASFPWVGRALRDRVVSRVGFDPAGKWLAMLANGRLFAHPLAKTEEEWVTKAALGDLRDFAYHPKGGILAVVDEDGRAHDLDPATGAVARTFKWKRGPLYSVAFAPDGLTCAAGAGGGRVLVWDVDA